MFYTDDRVKWVQAECISLISNGLLFNEQNPVTGLEETLPEIQLYPNPVVNELFVNTEVESNITIFDITGRVIKTSTISTDTGFDLGHLSMGVYFVRLEAGGKSVV